MESTPEQCQEAVEDLCMHQVPQLDLQAFGHQVVHASNAQPCTLGHQLLEASYGSNKTIKCLCTLQHEDLPLDYDTSDP